jgi:hypothetical protein
MHGVRSPRYKSLFRSETFSVRSHAHHKQHQNNQLAALVRPPTAEPRAVAIDAKSRRTKAIRDVPDEPPGTLPTRRRWTTC